MMSKITFVNLFLALLFVCGVISIFLSGIIMLPEVSSPSIQHEQQGPSGGNIVFSATDAKTQTPLEGVTYYLNDVFAGISDRDGLFVLRSGQYPSGTVTVLAVKEGYRDHVRRVDLTFYNHIEMEFEPSSLYPVFVNGPSEKKIDIVFVPSDTSFNGTTKTKLSYAGYPGGREQFAADVTRFINRTFARIPLLMADNSSDSLQYFDKFNFYYYWDGKTFGDAFNGCAGTIPENYWHEVTFSDLTILLYPTYYGQYLDPSSQPIGCTNTNGLGNVYMKVAADQYYLAIHETGHGLYGLMDTYCGDTYYSENTPNANIWSSKDRCRAYAIENSRNPDNCLQITDTLANGCRKNFWRWDPDPDLMKEAYYGRLGEASTARIASIMNHY
jgi:hypothetical protein